MFRRKMIASTVVAILSGLVVVGVASARGGRLDSPELQAVRAAAARYHSYDQAVADGYSVAGEPCIAEPGRGAMGIHAPNPSLIGPWVPDPLEPSILLYLPRADGSLRLVGVEYMTVALANTESGPAPWFDPQEPPPGGFITPRPSLFGQPFDGPMPGHNPSMPWHYDLHVWIYDENPAGTFAQFNPALSCG